MVAVYDQASSEADILLSPHCCLRDTAQAAKPGIERERLHATSHGNFV